ncbi:uncharacterized protein N7515_009565 [Penicillium bovifimosum]|uniref:Protection of telomeres protein 1 n=1 Tax=Penicillium bovifimosum TaxID=126998 RepID=A0A9W9GKN0_9EURO|nr:uncharacterized protein N7515_009565 [Penicillium bovifimosum]KAJ5121604.1 hypothetical protein N7515_009565 [Penicillium bovifimosum]
MASGDLTDIATAPSIKGRLNVIGVVVDTLPLLRTRGSSACITFTIKESDLDGPTWEGGLKVKYFNDDESCLPSVRLNDVVLLRSVFVKIYQGKPMGVVSQRDTVSWAVFRSESHPGSSPFVTSGPMPFEPSLKERDRAQSLLELVSAESVPAQPFSSHNIQASRQPHGQAASSVPKAGGLPHVLIEAVEVNKICQLLGQVVKLNTYDSEKSLLYLTDYTQNESLKNYKKPGDDDDSGREGDRFNHLNQRGNDWPGPWGRLTILVTLWEPHASYAREKIQAGDIVLLTYTRIKQGQYGIEASVHEDRKYREKIHVRKLIGKDDERVQALMERRTAYWKIHGEPKTENKKAKKRNKKVQQKKEARKEEGQLTLPAASRIKLNPQVKTRNYAVPIVSVEKILLAETHRNNGPGGVDYKLPFQNVNYHTQVRVVDFFPHSIEDFSVRINTAPLSSSEDSSDDPHHSWEWRFCLLVEGAEPKASKQEPRQLMKIYVCGQDGDEVLNSIAVDLRNNPDKLNETREKLFQLWGNLEEQKSKARAAGLQSWEGVSSRPFECCIKEYGVPCTHVKDPNAMDVDGEVCSEPFCLGWERRFAMFGTTIHI